MIKTYNLVVGEHGGELRADLMFDKTTLTTPTAGFEARKPDGTVVEFTAGILGAATEGHMVITYDVLAADIDQKGVWRLRPFGTDATTKVYGEEQRIVARENFSA